jgi:hypothetical protein
MRWGHEGLCAIHCYRYYNAGGRMQPLSRASSRLHLLGGKRSRIDAVPQVLCGWPQLHSELVLLLELGAAGLSFSCGAMGKVQ